MNNQHANQLEDFLDYELYDIDKWNIPQYSDVLIVEDDVTTSRLIKAIARRSQQLIRIKSFSAAEDTILHIHTLKANGLIPPDLAIVDVYLKGAKDGFHVAKELQTLFPETMVVMSTSMNPKLFYQKSERFNITPEFLPKPFTIRQMASLFERLN